MTYFASDGNYGDDNNLVIVDTFDWGFAEWTMIEQASDAQRGAVAAEIASRFKMREILKGGK